MDDDLTRRLRALSAATVPPSTSAAHLAAMAEIGAPRERRRFGRAAVGLAALAGFLVGGSGLAMAGALPAPAQSAAAAVLAQAGVEAPRPAGAGYGRCVSDAAKAKGGDEEAQAEVEGERTEEQVAFKAAKEACREAEQQGGRGPKGPGEQRGRGPGAAGPQSTPKADDGDPCTGPPPWAGRMDKAAKAAAREAHALACPGRAADDEPDGDG